MKRHDNLHNSPFHGQTETQTSFFPPPPALVASFLPSVFFLFVFSVHSGLFSSQAVWTPCLQLMVLGPWMIQTRTTLLRMHICLKKKKKDYEFALHLSHFVVISVGIFSHKFPEDISCVLVGGNDVWGLTFFISGRHFFFNHTQIVLLLLSVLCLIISLKKKMFPPAGWIWPGI